MYEFIDKKKSKAKVFRIVLVVLLVAYFLSYAMLAFFEPNQTIGPIVIVNYALLICGIVYYVSYHPFMVSLKLLETNGYENIFYDINLDTPTLAASKIYCGQFSFFCKKPCVIIPYAEIAWVYLYEQRTYGIVTNRSVVVCTRDGKKFMLKADRDEFQWLIDNYILKHSPNVVLGFGEEQRRHYKQQNPKAVANTKRTRRIIGIILMIIGASFVVPFIITFKDANIVGALLLIFGFFGTGAILYLLNRKD